MMSFSLFHWCSSVVKKLGYDCVPCRYHEVEQPKLKIVQHLQWEIKLYPKMAVRIYLASQNIATVLAHASTAVTAVSDDPSILYSTQNMCSDLLCNVCSSQVSLP